VTGSAFAIALCLVAPPGVADLAPLDRQARDFYGAIGPAVVVQWQADVTTATVGSDVTVSLVVRNALNADELQRPPLELPADTFQVLNAVSPPRRLPGNAVAFDSLLRPRRAGTFQLPALPYAYYRPDRPDGKRFLTAYADPLTLTVLPSEPTTGSPEQPTHPALILSLPQETWADRLPVWAWLVPVGAVFPCRFAARWIIDSRLGARASECHPAFAQARRRLADAGGSDDPVAAIRSALHDYLTARHGLPGVARTPREIGAAVPSTPAMAAVVAVLERCDATRFSPAGDDALSLARAGTDAAEACEKESA
jgi:hypothetical protein